MKKALIMGITGSFGRHVAAALAADGWQLSALVRDPQLSRIELDNVVLHQGGAEDIDSIRRAAADVALIVYGVNPANYDWRDKALPWLSNAAQVAEEKGLTMLFPGNVYVFDPKDGPMFDECSPMKPLNEKGQIRLTMEQRLQQASQQGARVIIVRAGDFISAEGKSTWLTQLIKRTRKGYSLTLPGDAALPHSWAYLPDLARTIAEILTYHQQLSPFEVFHYAGHRASLNDIAEAICVASGRAVTMRNFPWWLLSPLAHFSALLQGLFEMRYLWQQELNLSSNKLEQLLGRTLDKTTLAQALIEAGMIDRRSGDNEQRDVMTNRRKNII